MIIGVMITQMITAVYSQVPTSIPPAMLSQIGNMSPAQIRDMANQYGINLDQMGFDLWETCTCKA